MVLIMLLYIIILIYNVVENKTNNLITQNVNITKMQAISNDEILFSYEKYFGINKFNKMREKRLTKARIQILGSKSKLANNSILIDGINHFEIEKCAKCIKIHKIENEFRRFIAMKGIKYIYKRDLYWRTWRKVHYHNDTRLVFYKYLNTIKLNSTSHLGGFWVIESEPPPCPFEILSIISKQQMCVTNDTSLGDVKNSCPLIITYGDLTATCDNPIETKWKIRRVYGAPVSELFPTLICEGRENCEITTSYMINPNFITFRIINSPNKVIYSRVMKAGRKNYACCEDCGHRDPKTMVIKTNNLS